MTEPRSHLFGVVAGLALAAGLVLSAMIATRAWIKIHETHSIAVTGSARKNIRADLIVWKASFLSEAKSLIEAQTALKADSAKVLAFLQSRGVTDAVFQPIKIEEVRGREFRDTKGNFDERTFSYRLTQPVEIRSTDLDRVMQMDRESASLVGQGVLFTAATPQFIYTKAGETKIEMLGEATKDARARAALIAQQGGSRIGGLQSARMGVFQITPLHSSQTSWEGMNDTTSLEKTVTAVVTATFSLK
ncbi:MAG: SIMPL domain-containing protein [Verrucomicrobia bacterium]|nr:SIMPL domain-containing protein [Verrucomicrobiota bacterium]